MMEHSSICTVALSLEGLASTSGPTAPLIACPIVTIQIEYQAVG